MSLSINERSASISFHSHRPVEFTGLVSKGNKDCAPLAWCEWALRCEGEIRMEACVFMDREQIVTLQSRLAEMLNELDANTADWRVIHGKGEEAKDQ